MRYFINSIREKQPSAQLARSTEPKYMAKMKAKLGPDTLPRMNSLAAAYSK